MTFGSAHLFAPGTSAAQARALLEAALDAGATRLDTAPSYGYGRSEELVVEVAAAAGVPVTTKVGLEAVAPPSRARWAAGRALRAVRPRRPQDGPGTPPSDAPSGRFAPAAVGAGIDRSLRRSQRRGGPARLDRLLLHEVLPADVTDELLTLLAARVDAGDVGQLGTATRNALTAPCLARGAGLLTVAHVSASRRGPGVPALPAGVHVVGHGLLGAGGADLAAARRALGRGPRRRDGGALATELVRLAAAGLPEVVVATRRLERVAEVVRAAAGRGEPPDAALRDTLATVVAR